MKTMKTMKMMKMTATLCFPVIALILELLPYGAVCVFADSPTEKIRRTFSYFDLTPFGYANFAPLITALLTCLLLLFAVISLFKTDRKKPIFLLSVLAAVVSLCPLLYGVEFFSPVGAIITVALVAEGILVKVHPDHKPDNNAG